MSNQPSSLEIQNGAKVLDILNEQGIICEVERDDIFVVKEPDLGLQLVVDAEESTVCLIMEICDLPALPTQDPEAADQRLNLYERLLEINNTSVHGAFCVDGNKLLLKDNLEIENLDPNELTASISSMFLIAAANLEEIGTLVGEPVAA